MIRESFDLWPQNDEPLLVMSEVPYEIGTGVPDVGRARVDRGEDIEQVLNIHVLRNDPNPGLFGSVSIELRVKYRSLAMRRSRDDFWFLGWRWSRSGASIMIGKERRTCQRWWSRWG